MSKDGCGCGSCRQGGACEGASRAGSLEQRVIAAFRSRLPATISPDYVAAYLERRARREAELRKLLRRGT